MAVYGYARVSTIGQSLASQVDQLAAAGCRRIFKEKASGKNADRPELRRMMWHLRDGDVIIVTRLDRLCRSSLDLANIMDQIGKAGAKFKSLHEAWCDTSSMHGRLIVTIMGGFAQFERELILARTAEGKRRAREKGVVFGRKSKLTPAQRLEALAMLKAGEMILTVARRFNVHSSTICRLHNRRLTTDAAIEMHVAGEYRPGH